MNAVLSSRFALGRRSSASILIIVLWVVFGLVSVTLYFAQSMRFELRASENRVTGLAAEQAIEGAARYVTFLLANLETNGMVPDFQFYKREAVPVGDANFWLIGRSDREVRLNDPFFGLVDEASKLNLNTATVEMLEALPLMTAELAAAIVDWRDSDSEPSANGAESEAYARLQSPYSSKNSRYETIEELRLVFGSNMQILFGEDANFNGVLDPNENDADRALPDDNRDGRLDSGILEFVTIYSREPATRSDGSPRVNVSQNRQQLAQFLQERFETERANEILANLGPPAATFNSLLEFYIRSRMTAEEFAQIEGELTASGDSVVEGLVNVNTAGAAVLACIPGIGADHAPDLIAFRQTNPGRLTSVAWIAEVLEQDAAIEAGPFLTSRSYQFTADIAALGRFGRGYRRTRFVFDVAEGEPKILYRQDLSHLGWALGRQARQAQTLTAGTR